MSSFCTIHEHDFPLYDTIENAEIQKPIGRVKKYSWKIFSMNMRQIAESGKKFNTATRARDAAKRFIKAVGNCHMRSGVVRRRRK